MDFAKYAHRYLAEVQYRFNRRFNLAAILGRLLHASAATKLNPERRIRAAEFGGKSGNRKTDDGDLRLFEAVRQSPLQSQFLLPVKRQRARPKRSRQKARDQVTPRTAQVELRYLPVTIDPPAGLDDKLPITLWVVHVREFLGLRLNKPGKP